MEALNQTQINAMKQGIRAEEQRRKESGEAPLTPYEKHQMEMGYMNDAADTSAAEDNISQIGNIRTSPKRGSVVISGSYKGMHPRAAERAAMTGQVPVKGGRPGQIGNGLLDEFYAKNPHLNRRSIVDYVSGKSPTPAAPASPSINMASPYGIVAGVVQTAAQNALKEKTTAETNAAMAQGIHDAKQGVVERGPRAVIWNNGATVMTGSTGNKTLTSPYGGGSSRLLHPTPPAPATAAPATAAPANPAQSPISTQNPSSSESKSGSSPWGRVAGFSRMAYDRVAQAAPDLGKMAHDITAQIGAGMSRMAYDRYPKHTRTGFQGPVPSYTQIAADTSAARSGIQTIKDAVQGTFSESDKLIHNTFTGPVKDIKNIAGGVSTWLHGDPEAAKRLQTPPPAAPAVRR